MNHSPHTWALILAAGDGKRLSDLTIDREGQAVPKQFCSLYGGPSLLEVTIARARRFARPDRVSVIVAAQHRRWWASAAKDIDARGLVIQPSNRGTALGILLQLLHVMRSDPQAQIVLLPSDHFVGNESVLTDAILHSLVHVQQSPREIVLLGMEATVPDCGLGYITRGVADQHGLFAVERFVEKPSIEAARELLARRALWNTFIIAASLPTLIDRFEAVVPQVLHSMRSILGSPDGYWRQIEALYEGLAAVDFSSHILQTAPAKCLRVLPVADCDWSDLGTPARVLQTLAGVSPQHLTRDNTGTAPVNLAARCRPNRQSRDRIFQ